ncbi:hypothetical protein TNIN_266231 [Trichonephila inaurata madagascariensis]|uniref:Uncharacterized protein n=1 Tax=Trichonephila inaurata madagascariensis TaxID=2747483 RepID=A0A8X6I815_9ARAC|nr:hypothetical protein TNIN_266231 [Trichonephila inaurata madagascariensis]
MSIVFEDIGDQPAHPEYILLILKNVDSRKLLGHHHMPVDASYVYLDARALLARSTTHIAPPFPLPLYSRRIKIRFRCDTTKVPISNS